MDYAQIAYGFCALCLGVVFSKIKTLINLIQINLIVFLVFLLLSFIKFIIVRFIGDI